MKAPDLSVIAPCLNEEDNVGPLVQRLSTTFAGMAVHGEVVLVDDGSRDATWARISALREQPGVVGIRHERNHGIEVSWVSGLRGARADVACFIDSDLQNRPEDVARLHEVWRQGDVDLVQAVRQPQGADRRRLVYSRTLNAMLNLAFGMRLRDNKSGFVMGRRDTLALLLQHAWRYRYYQTFLGVAAGLRGLRIAEVDAIFDRRAAGTSFLAGFPVGAILRVLVEVAKYRVETWVAPPRPAPRGGAAPSGAAGP